MDLANTVTPVPAMGFSRGLEDGRISVLYSYPLGMGGVMLPADGVPAALLPGGAGPLEAGAPVLESHSHRAVESFLRDNHARRLISLPLAGIDPPIRVWFGLANADTLTPEQLERLDSVATGAATLLSQELSREEQFQQLNRLEQAAQLIPALLHVLDVREVIDRLSATARRALPHDLLLLNLFNDELTTFTVYARSDQGAGLGMVRPNPYPASTIKAWSFSIVDDHLLHPMERDSPSTRIGARSSLRFPIRFDDRVIGGVAFVSFKPHGFTDADVRVGKRLSEHVASAISHFILAGQLAEQARRTEELRAQTTNLELLDELLSRLNDSGGIQDAFERATAVAGKVMTFDGSALSVYLPGGERARMYASIGMPNAPQEIEIPREFLDPAWEFDRIDDVTVVPGEHNQRVGSLGFFSALRMPLRLDGKRVGGLVFLSRTRAAFTEGDVLVARRLADRLAATLARDTTIEAIQRADEATERASRLEARVQALTQELDARTGFRRVIGESAPWRQVLKQATQVAATETTVLLLGESGTGKEVIARFLHRASPRSSGPFVALNCAALPDQLLEAELFGYERGAFTGATQSKPGQLEQAAGGTLFLDEVGEMSLAAQAKFLRVLQEREFQRLGGTRALRSDARIIAATNRDLPKAIANGLFREDLFYRLNVFAIGLPRLRDRRDDILLLTQAFLTEFGRVFANPPAGISREARERLLAHHWPGNIRELRNTLERAAILCDGGLITEHHLALTAMPASAATSSSVAEIAAAPPAPEAARDLHSMERAAIEQALQKARFNKSKAAKELGLTRHQLYIRLRRHGLEE
jgi:transcriptional regulator with GAF, ATPase, and Fis domain